MKKNDALSRNGLCDDELNGANTTLPEAERHPVISSTLMVCQQPRVLTCRRPDDGEAFGRQFIRSVGRAVSMSERRVRRGVAKACLCRNIVDAKSAPRPVGARVLAAAVPQPAVVNATPTHLHTEPLDAQGGFGIRDAFATSRIVEKRKSVAHIEELARGADAPVTPQVRPYAIFQRTKLIIHVIESNPYRHDIVWDKVKIW